MLFFKQTPLNLVFILVTQPPKGLVIIAFIVFVVGRLIRIVAIGVSTTNRFSADDWKRGPARQ